MHQEELALSMTDWTKAAADDLAAFDALMLRHQRQVIGTALRLLGNAEDAHDAAQEVFFRLYKHRDRIDQEAGAWLYRVTVNVCFDLRRKRRELPIADEYEPAADDAGVESALDQEQRRELVKRALRRLPERQRAAVVLREIEGLSTAEVAEALGLSEVTIRSQISTAKVKLRELCASLMRKRR